MGMFSEYHQYREEINALTEVLQFEQEILRLVEYKKTHPGKGIPEKKKSDIVKKARRGEDMFGKGKEFKKIAEKAGKKYGDEEAGKRVAGAIFWKKAKGKHMTKEDVDNLIWIVEDDLEVILDHAIQYQELKEENESDQCAGCYKDFPKSNMVGIQTSHDDIKNYCKGCAGKKEAHLKSQDTETYKKPYRIRPAY